MSTADTRARIATVSQEGLAGTSLDENRARMMDLLDRVLQHRPDLVCPPEAFTLPGVAGMSLAEKVEPVPGPTVEAAARRAREHRCYVICPVRMVEEGRFYNAAVIVDRAGRARRVGCLRDITGPRAGVRWRCPVFRR